MPYNRWTQFRRQRKSVGLSGGTAASGGQTYANRPQPPPGNWHNHNRFSQEQNNKVLATGLWLPNANGEIVIPTVNVPPELLLAVENYGSFLRSLQLQAVPLITPTAVGTVIYDAQRDQLVYGVSGYNIPQVSQPVLQQRIATILQMSGGTLNSSGYPPNNCAEVHALNWALELGCQEADMHVWTFRVSNVRPLPRCGNCRITLPLANYAMIWTC